MDKVLMKENFVLTGFCLAFFLSIFAGPLWCSDISVETFTIPRFNGSYNLRNFTGIALDGRSNRLSLTNDTGWCEIPYRNGQISAQGAFMAPTKGFKLRAVASSPSGVLVYDVLSHSLMGDAGSYRLAQPIANPTGMTRFQDRICIADGRRNKLYVVQLSGQQADVIQSHSLPSGVVGLAAGQRTLYAATSRRIYQYDQNFDLMAQYDLTVSINGLTAGPQGEFLAVAQGANKIYLIRGIPSP